MEDRREEFIDRLAAVSPAPEGIDIETNIIAKIPPEILSPLLRPTQLPTKAWFRQKLMTLSGIDYLQKNHIQYLNK